MTDESVLGKRPAEGTKEGVTTENVQESADGNASVGAPLAVGANESGQEAKKARTEETSASSDKRDRDSRGNKAHRGGHKARGEGRDNRDKRGDRNRGGGGGRGDWAEGGEAGARTKTAEGGEESGEVRLPKRNVSVYFGYCGIGYSGLQINPGVKTIEGDIFEALCQAGAVSKDNAVNPTKVGLQRSARTDRGVHAAGNLLSLKLILEPAGIESGGLVARVNELLPPFIRIWGLTRVQNSFNARTSCDSRQYEYLLPTYVFVPPKPGSSMWEMMNKSASSPDQTEEQNALLSSLLDHPFWQKQGTDKVFAEDTAAKKAWRMPLEHLERVRKIFTHYLGSHNFHNFTVGKPFRDRSAHRHMLKLTISDPKIINETEWVSIKFHGQSFMLHQIRKMIGLLILIGRTAAPDSLVPEMYGPARVHIPKAPGLGLLLEQPIFEIYNRRMLSNLKRQNDQSSAPGPGDGKILKNDVVFSRFEDEMQKFKEQWIYQRIYKEEEERHEYSKFLQYLDVFVGPDFEYLNPRGIITQSSIIKVGEQHRMHDEMTKKKAAKERKAAEGGESDEDVDDDDEDEALLKGNQAELEG